MCFLYELQCASAGRPGSSLVPAGGSSGAVKDAMDRLGRNPDAVAAVHALARVPTSSGDELREKARAAEMNSAFGLDIATILHQETLAKAPTGDLSALTREVWQRLYEVRPRLAVARKEHFKHIAPAHILLPSFLDAVSTGKLTLDLIASPLAGMKQTEVDGLRTRRVAHAWTLLIAVVKDVTPRDATAERELQKLGREFFDQAIACAPLAITNVLQPVLTELREQAEMFKDHITAEPGTWAAAIAEAKAAAQRRFAAGGSSIERAPADTTKADAAATKADEALKKIEKQQAELAKLKEELKRRDAADADAAADPDGGVAAGGKGRGRGK